MVNLDPTIGKYIMDILVTLLLIGLTLWFLRNKIRKITEIFDEQLYSSLHRLFDKSDRQPLYKIFYGFHHSNIDLWISWVKTLKPKKQEIAFWRLADYLKEPPKELGSITLDVVRAVIGIEHDSSYEVLTMLLRNSRIKWGQYKALNTFYEIAAIAIVEIDPTNAKTFLLNELNEISNLPDADSIKGSILEALAHLPLVDELAKIFSQISSNNDHSLKIRFKALDAARANNTEMFFKAAQKTLKDILSRVSLSKDDIEIFDHIMVNFLSLFQEGEYEDNIWSLIIKACWYDKLNLRTANLLAPKLRSSDFVFEAHQLVQLLQFSGEIYSIFCEALSQRFFLSQDEANIIQEAGKIKALMTTENLGEEVLSIEQNLDGIEVPRSLTNNYEKLNTMIRSRTFIPGIKVITGKAETEKLFLLKAMASEMKRTFIHISAKNIILSPDKMQEVAAILTQNKPCIVYLEDSFRLIQNIVKESDIHADNLINILKKFYKEQQINLIASIPYDMEEIRDEYPALRNILKDLPNDDIANSIDIGMANTRYKKKIFDYYESKLKEDREVELLDFEGLIDSTEDFTCLEFTNFLLQYLKTSLLCKGKLMPIANYQDLIK